MQMFPQMLLFKSHAWYLLEDVVVLKQSRFNNGIMALKCLGWRDLVYIPGD